MPNDPQIESRKELLLTYRQTLGFLLEQAAAYGGEVLAPPQTRAGLVQMREGVAQCKRELRGLGVEVDDDANDTATVAPQAVPSAPPPAPPDAYSEYRAYLLRLLPPPDADALPYQGLLTFQYEHADRFFGRDQLVVELAELVQRAPFLAVLGASGSGKSSLVQAGLLPLLKAGALPGSQDWRYLTLKPGARPLDSLAATLTEARGGSLIEALELSPRLAASDDALLLTARMFAPRLALIVDQAEELWTLQPTEPEARKLWQAQQQRPFIRLLLSALRAGDRPLLVILTMRADFLHRAADDPALARAISEHDVIVSPMTPEELRETVERPALQAGGSFEAGLVEELVGQAHGQPGALPLLEYTLLALWKQRDADGQMTWDSYRRLGGVEGALARRADLILEQRYTPEQRAELRRVLPRLIQPGEGAADTRRRAALADLAAASVHILQGHAGAVHTVAWSPDGTTALTGGEDASARLWDGPSGQVLRVLKGHSDAVLSAAWSPDGATVLTGSSDRTARLWKASDGSALFTLAGHGDSVTSVSWRPDGQRVLSSSWDGSARVWEAGSGAQIEQSPSRAGASWTQAAWSSDGSRILLASGQGDGAVVVWTAGTTSTLDLRGRVGSPSALAWHADGSVVAVGGGDGSVVLWEAQSGREIHTFQGHTSRVSGVAWSPDGKTLLTSSYDDSARIWAVDRELLMADLTRRVCDTSDEGAALPELVRGWSWEGCAAALAAVQDDLTEYDRLRGR